MRFLAGRSYSHVILILFRSCAFRRVVGGQPGDSVRRRDLGGEQGKFNKAGNENVQNCGSMHFVQPHADIVAMTRSQDWSEKHEGKIYRESQVLKRKRIKTIK